MSTPKTTIGLEDEQNISHGSLPTTNTAKQNKTTTMQRRSFKHWVDRVLSHNKKKTKQEHSLDAASGHGSAAFYHLTKHNKTTTTTTTTTTAPKRELPGPSD